MPCPLIFPRPRHLSYPLHNVEIIEHIIQPFQQDLRDIMESDFGIGVGSKGKISSQVEVQEFYIQNRESRYVSTFLQLTIYIF